MEGPKQKEHPQQEAEIANAVHDERLIACIGRGFPEEVEPNQKVATKPHSLPPDKQDHIIRSEDQRQHEKHEQIQVREEAVVTAFVSHVAGGVDVNQESDARHHKHHHHGELVKLQVKAYPEVTSCAHPTDEFFAERLFTAGHKLAHGLERAHE